MTKKGVHVRVSPEIWERAKKAVRGPERFFIGSLGDLVEVALMEKLESSKVRLASRDLNEETSSQEHDEFQDSEDPSSP